MTRELPLSFESPTCSHGDIVGKSWRESTFLSVTLKLSQGRSHRAQWPSCDPRVWACSCLQKSPQACQILVICVCGPSRGHAEPWERQRLSPSWALHAETRSEGKAGLADWACAPSATGVSSQHRCQGQGRSTGATQNWKVRWGEAMPSVYPAPPGGQ